MSRGSVEGRGVWKRTNACIGLAQSFTVHLKLSQHCELAVSSVQFSRSVFMSPCEPMDCRTPGFPVHHQLPELAQTHVHWVDDAIQPSHPLSSPSPAFSLFQHQGLFQWVSFSHQGAKVLKLQLQHQLATLQFFKLVILQYKIKSRKNIV